VNDPLVRGTLQAELKGFPDLERITARTGQGLAAPRDLQALRKALAALPAVRRIAARWPELALPESPASLDEVQRALNAALADEVPATLKDGGVFRAGFDQELDGVVDGSRAARDWIAGLELLELAASLGQLDAVAALATVAGRHRWVRPSLREQPGIDITGGRHPLVEAALGPGRFVPNDLRLESETSAIVLLSGPNMAGKSTYLRQAGIIVLLAQVGSYVPADRAVIGICDRIFTRVGAHDELARGLSTFMVEMVETAHI